MSRGILPALLAALLLLGHSAWNAALAFDELSEGLAPTHFLLRSGLLTLVFKGELELELHDLEGEGGPGNDSPTDTKTIGTRSPFVEIDSFWLAPRLGIGDGLAFLSLLEFRPDGARVGGAWADVLLSGPQRLEHHVEAGYNSPFVKIDQRTERYPLIATAWWREPELHLAYEAAWSPTTDVRLLGGVSLAMMRPLAPAGVQESTSHPGTINILASAPARAFSGNGPVCGARLRLDAFGTFVEAFGYLGRMAAEGGTDVLRSALPNYRYLDGGDEQGRYGDFRWAGARLGYSGYGAHALVEGIASREDLLQRYGAYALISYEVPLAGGTGWFVSMEPLVRAETLRIEGSTRISESGHALRSTAPVNASSWDFDVMTAAVIARLYGDLLRMRVEYYLIREHNGVPAQGVDNVPFRNDELLVQLELRF